MTRASELSASPGNRTSPRLWVRDAERGWLRFSGRRRVIAAWTLGEVESALDALASAIDQGEWAVGYIAFDAAPALDQRLTTKPSARQQVDGPPLLWWSVGEPPSRVEAPEWPSLEASRRIMALEWRPRMHAAEHREAVDEIRQRIAAGDTYQANLTFQLDADLRSGDLGAEAIDPWLLFRHLQAVQQADYAVYLDVHGGGIHGGGDGRDTSTSATGERWAVCSVSPELFFEHSGDQLRVRPMKGTAPRGRFSAEDETRRAELRSAKNRAENLMITDMMRNDLGRVARPGSVQVTRLFAEETYPTVHQLVSEVVAQTSLGSVDVLRALFPCASITGAPKYSSMDVIAQVENSDRGLYTGAVGWLGPSTQHQGGSPRRAQLAVAIRTAVVDQRSQTASFGTGGGIVWDSRAELEYAECQTKARILEAQPRRPVELFETLLWRPKSGFARLDQHLARMQASARYFNVSFDPNAAVTALDASVAHADARQRVRLDLVDGRSSATASPGPCAGPDVWALMLDDQPVDASEISLFHKTTDRRRYDAAIERATERATARNHSRVDEVILWNSDGCITEGTRTNVVVKLDGRWLTPALECGLLPGIYRQKLLRDGKIEEALISLDEFIAARDIFLVNSLRGRLPARLADDFHPLADSRRLVGGFE